MTIQYLVSVSYFWSSGMPPARIKHPRKAKLFAKLVDIPKPLSISYDGIISSSILGVVQRMTPAAKP